MAEFNLIDLHISLRMNQNEMHQFFYEFTSAVVVAAVVTADKGDNNNDFNDYDNIVSQIMC